MRRGRRSIAGVESEIPTSSMSDIAFLLIIFFMVTAAFAVTKGLEADLPGDSAPQGVEGKDSVLIELRSGGSLTVDCKPMERDQILEYLGPILLRNPEKPVVVYTHEGAEYQQLVDAYEVLLRAPEKGLPTVNTQIPTPSDLKEYVELFGFDPFKEHCDS